MRFVAPLKRFLTARQYERKYSCRIHSEARIYAQNSHVNESIVLGDHSHIRGELFTFGHGGEISVGNYCYVGENSRVWSAKSIRIGNRVLIAHNCSIFDSDTHPLDASARHRQFVSIITSGHPKEIDLREEPVVIEDDAWICSDVIILKGVRVGRGAVVGAGSVVTSDVPPHTLVAGNPARVIRELTA